MACSSRRRSWPRRWATEADARLGEAPGEQPLPASRLLKSASAAVELFGWGPPLQGKSFASGGGRRCKGISSAAWFRVLLQHAGAVHPCTARTKSPCSDVLRDRGVRRFGGHCLRAAGTGIDEATDIQVAKDAAVRGSGASRPWMACARLLEPGTAQPGDAHDPRTAAAPPEGDIPRCFEAALPRLPPKPRDSGALQAGRIRHLPIGRRTKKKPQPLPVGASIGGVGTTQMGAQATDLRELRLLGA